MSEGGKRDIGGGRPDSSTSTKVDRAPVEMDEGNDPVPAAPRWLSAGPQCNDDNEDVDIDREMPRRECAG